MTIEECPYCNIKVALKEDGTCPSCCRPIASTQANSKADDTSASCYIACTQGKSEAKGKKSEQSLNQKESKYCRVRCKNIEITKDHICIDSAPTADACKQANCIYHNSISMASIIVGIDSSMPREDYIKKVIVRFKAVDYCNDSCSPSKEGTIEPKQEKKSNKTGLCDICNRELGQNAEEYLLTTLEVVSAPGYWKKAFQMMSAFNNKSFDDSFKAQFAKDMASQNAPWMVCRDCIDIFSTVDKAKAKEYAIRWEESGGTFTPPGSGAVPFSKVNMGDEKVYIQRDTPDTLLEIVDRLLVSQNMEEKEYLHQIVDYIYYIADTLGIIGKAADTSIPVLIKNLVESTDAISIAVYLMNIGMQGLDWHKADKASQNKVLLDIISYSKHWLKEHDSFNLYLSFNMFMRVSGLNDASIINKAFLEITKILKRIKVDANWTQSNADWQAAVPGLIKFLEAKNHSIWIASAKALAEIGAASSQAIPSLIKLLAKVSDSSDIKIIEETLVKIDPHWQQSKQVSQSIPNLMAIIENDDKITKTRVIKVLSQIGSAASQALPLLIKLLIKSNSDSISAAEALNKIDPNWYKSEEAYQAISNFITILISQDYKKILETTKILAKMGTAASSTVPSLIKLLKAWNKDIRIEVAKALGEIGPAASQAIPFLKKRTWDWRKDVRIAATEALHKIQSI